MRAIAPGLLLLSLVAFCHRRDEPTPTPIPASAPIATTSAIAAASASSPHKRDTMKPELKRLLDVLRSGSGHRGEVRGTFDDLRRSLGPDAKDWPIAAMLKELEVAGEISIHFLSTEAGADPAFVLSAWRD